MFTRTARTIDKTCAAAASANLRYVSVPAKRATAAVAYDTCYNGIYYYHQS